jgi:SAM-dependent methyltransferase
MQETKQSVRDFYDEIGWTQDAEGLYHNARYEDQRAVSREYIHRCHLRVNRHLAANGHYFLDAGSGPVQWPEYLTYSAGYKFRVCADISIKALQDARVKLETRGLYVVADIANLPFKANVFDGVVSIHAIHHLPAGEHGRAFRELHRVLGSGRKAVAVNGWHRPLLMRIAEPLIRLGRALSGRSPKRKKDWKAEVVQNGTFVHKMTPGWLEAELRGAVDFEVYTWRSLSPRFMQWFIRPDRWGGAWLRLVFWLEERFPRFLGLHGQYPLIVIRKH